MKLTKQKLKQIIKEEIQEAQDLSGPLYVGPGFHKTRPMGNKTHPAAPVQGVQDAFIIFQNGKTGKGQFMGWSIETIRKRLGPESKYWKGSPAQHAVDHPPYDLNIQQRGRGRERGGFWTPQQMIQRIVAAGRVVMKVMEENPDIFERDRLGDETRKKLGIPNWIHRENFIDHFGNSTVEADIQPLIDIMDQYMPEPEEFSGEAEGVGKWNEGKMKITKQKLKQIIKEEINLIFEDQVPTDMQGNPIENRKQLLKIFDLEREPEDEKEIKTQYRKLVKLHHPDRNPDDPGAKARIQIINNAYGALTGPGYIYSSGAKTYIAGGVGLGPAEWMRNWAAQEQEREKERSSRDARGNPEWINDILRGKKPAESEPCPEGQHRDASGQCRPPLSPDEAARAEQEWLHRALGLEEIIKEELSRFLREATELGPHLLTRGALRTMPDKELQTKIDNIDVESNPAQEVLLKRLKAEQARREQMKQLQTQRHSGAKAGGSTIPVEEAAVL